MFFHIFCLKQTKTSKLMTLYGVLFLAERGCQAEFFSQRGQLSQLFPHKSATAHLFSRLKERTDIDRLPDNVMLKVFRNLTTEELLTAGKVRDFFHISFVKYN